MCARGSGRGDKVKTRRKPVPEDCGDCGGTLTADERAYPWLSPHDEAVCTDCEFSNYHFRCAICDDYELLKYQHKILAVFEPEEAFRADDHQAGLYRIARLPYYTDAMLNAWLHDWALEYVAPIPKNATNAEEYPCGHLCRKCVKKHGKQVAPATGQARPA